MAYEPTTFVSLLNGYGIIAGLAIDSTTGLRTPTTAEKAEFAALLNEVVAMVWSKSTWPFQLLPSITAKATVTPTSGVIAWSDIAYAPKWSVWTRDPADNWTSTAAAAGKACNARETPDGLLVKDQAAATSLVVYYQTTPPRFTHTAWATGTAYVADDIVLQGSNCYKCATAHTSGTFATDLTNGKWTVQTLPMELRQPVLRLVAELRAGDVQGKVAKTAQEQGRGLDLLDAVFTRAATQGLPWYSHNGGIRS